MLEGPAVERIHVTPSTVAPERDKKHKENSVTYWNETKFRQKRAKNLLLILFWMLKGRLHLVSQSYSLLGCKEGRPWERSWERLLMKTGLCRDICDISDVISAQQKIAWKLHEILKQYFIKVE